MTLEEVKNTIRCGHWCTVLRRGRLAPLKMYRSAQPIKMSSVRALQVQAKYPHGVFFCGHVNPPCRRAAVNDSSVAVFGCLGFFINILAF